MIVGCKRCIVVVTTSTVSSLIPQDPLQVSGPGFLQLHAGGLQGVGVFTLPPAKPDLKTQSTHNRVMGHPNVTRLGEKHKETHGNYTGSKII